ncbi:MAG: 3-deoxy-manno-octulosonate-8-phosphatase KdsC [Pseudomonadota bacterium]|nr:3-deoxy-manno-octulosonate-8-phosphatase KdsC [Pseudomonadota bacterium]HEX2237009.1 3-deoxy-manno-octulosonate-8-phosphatase KdsC [Gammaproteobacteria bacterium]
MEEISQRAANIRLAVFDVDGVLTDGTLFIGDDGQEYKAFSTKDGHGLRMLQHYGVIIAIITGRDSKVVARRMAELGIEHVLQGHREKLPAFEQLLARLAISASETAYVGDDVVDIPLLRRVGLAIAVQDAHSLVKRHAHWTTANPGGRGAVREVCELILQAQGSLDEAMRHYLT